MRSMILEQLYTGNIGAAHMPPYKTESSEYYAEQVNDLAAQLEQKLDEQGRRLLGRLQDASMAVSFTVSSWLRRLWPRCL